MNSQDVRQDRIFTKKLLGQELTFHTTWGLFSPEGIDEGSEMLLDEVEVKPTDTVLDIGCGYGALGITLAKKAKEVHMVDKDFVAVEYAQINCEVNDLKNTQVYLSNGFSHVPHDTKFDVIVSNLPAKVSKEMYYIFFEDALKHLNRGGKLYVVVIAGLKEFIKRSFTEYFGNFEKCRQGKTYMVAMAVKE